MVEREPFLPGQGGCSLFLGPKPFYALTCEHEGHGIVMTWITVQPDGARSGRKGLRKGHVGERAMKKRIND